MSLTVTLNGQLRTFEDLTAGVNLHGLLAALGLAPDRVALEVNGSITPRSGWANVVLEDQDKVELVHFVGGGSTSRFGQCQPGTETLKP